MDTWTPMRPWGPGPHQCNQCNQMVKVVRRSQRSWQETMTSQTRQWTGKGASRKRFQLQVAKQVHVRKSKSWKRPQQQAAQQAQASNTSFMRPLIRPSYTSSYTSLIRPLIRPLYMYLYVLLYVPYTSLCACSFNPGGTRLRSEYEKQKKRVHSRAYYAARSTALWNGATEDLKCTT